jgi:signal transduction histidine kinase
MNATLQPQPDRLARDYRGALYDYVACAGEAPLARAYQLGRDAIAEGRSIPDIVGIHGAALQELLAGAGTNTGAATHAEALVDAAAQFLAESLSPFEMTHRGYRDSLIAWRHINETLEQEISRIAHTLHDESGQLLVSVHLELAKLAREVPAARPHVDRCQQLLESIERQLRELSHELRPAVLDDLGWLAAIEFLAAAVTGRTQIPIEVRSRVTRRLPAAAEIALYRVVQEALTNAVRHADASCVHVEIEQRPDGLHGVIADDGVGFEVDACVRNGGMGLRGMRERLEAVGGSLRVISAPGSGAEIRFGLPLES